MPSYGNFGLGSPFCDFGILDEICDFGYHFRPEKGFSTNLPLLAFSAYKLILKLHLTFRPFRPICELSPCLLIPANVVVLRDLDILFIFG